MVGVPGDRLSNMAPPTLVKAGIAEVVRPFVGRLLQRRTWAAFNRTVNRFALPLFLFHTTGMALALGIDYFALNGGLVHDRTPDLEWWLKRPSPLPYPLP
jgi:hypothetical protein